MKKHEPRDSGSSPTPPSSRRRRWPLFMVLFLALIAGIVLSMPRILSSDTARTIVLQQVNNRLDGTISVRSWSFTWKRGIAFNGIRFESPDHEFCFEAGGLTLGFRMLDMARAAIAIRAAGPGAPISSDLQGEINLFRGSISAGGPDYVKLIANLNAQAKIDGFDRPCSFMLAADSVPEGGTIEITGTAQLQEEGVFDLEQIKSSSRLKVHEWDLMPVATFLVGADNMPENMAAVLGGVLNLKTDGLDSIDLDAMFALWPSLVAVPPDGDPQALGTIDLSCAVSMRGNRVDIQNLALDGDFLNTALSGNMMFSESNTIEDAAISFEGRADLAAAARLAFMLAPGITGPEILDHDETILAFNGEMALDMAGKSSFIDAVSATVSASLSEFDIGPVAELTLSAKEYPALEGRLTARIDASMNGIDEAGGKGNVKLDGFKAHGGFLGEDALLMDSVALDFDLARAGSHIVIDVLNLFSPLLNAEISGQVRLFEDTIIPGADLDIAAGLNVAEAARMFSASLSLHPDLALSEGMLNLNASCRTEEELVAFEARLATSKLAALRQEHEIRLEQDITASLKGMAGRNFLDIEHFEIDSSFARAEGSCNMEQAQIELSLDLAAASDEASKFIDTGGRSAAGKLTLETSAAMSGANRAEISARAALLDLRLSGFTPSPVNMDMTEAALEAEVDYDADMMSVCIPVVSVIATSDIASITMRGENIVLAHNAAPSAEILNILMESDLDLLLPLIRSVSELPDDVELTGKASASAECSIPDGILNISELDVRLTPFLFRKGDLLSVERSMNATGTFALPLVPAQDEERALRANADCVLLVESAEFLGIRISGLEAPLRLGQGRAELDLQTYVNDGTLTLPLRMDIAGQQRILEIPDNTRVLAGVRLTDAMVDKMLSKITPLLKGCAVSTGNMDLLLNRFRLPLDAPDPDRTEFHAVTSWQDISLSPAGLLFDILSLAKLEREKITIPDQDVQTRFRNGRFFSDPLMLKAGGNDIIISGSVGLDETLDYSVQIPITIALVGKEAYQALQGQNLVIPITGTVRNPAFDSDGFIAGLAKAARDAGAKKLIDEGERLLRDEGERLLRQLFGR